MKSTVFVGHRPAIQKELIEKSSVPPAKEAARSAADRMEELGLVNDRRICQTICQDYSTERIFRPLRSMNCPKGIDKGNRAQ